MKVLVLGGTQFFGKHMVNEFLNQGDEVTIATRGIAKDNFGDKVNRLILDRVDEKTVREALSTKEFDIVCDNYCYSSNELKYVLDNVKCRRYILTSTGSVYSDKLELDMKEEAFDPYSNELKWCTRNDFSYDIIKQQSETALFRHFDTQSSAAVRFPYVVGVDDYTKRLYHYVDCIVNSKALNINNLDSEIPFIDSKDAGKFIVFLAKSDFRGPINACSGSIPIKEIISYIEEKSGHKAIFNDEENDAPYNHAPSFSLNVDKAKSIGYSFMPMKDWFFKLLEELTQTTKN